MPETCTTDAIRQALRAVIDPCCRDRGISVVDMGLLSDITVDAMGHAEVEIMLTSGWCPFQVELTAEVAEAAKAVDGVVDASVHITLDRVWSPTLMSPDASAKLRLLPDPGQVADRDAYLRSNPLPIATVRPARQRGATP
ncbi:MAG TPA: iron-sulfur cluster assembly protein [Euzebya sp.]|nr:iron-sulfur cluster assembly protein [Euzebya sp.]